MRTDEPSSSPRWIVRSAEDFGRAIAGVRAERRLTQEALAEEVGVDRSYIARLERGMATLALERVLRMLRRMGATVTITLDDDRDDDAAG
jgi:transcriptional regulator with XRE-family HTH domain